MVSPEKYFVANDFLGPRKSWITTTYRARSEHTHTLVTSKRVASVVHLICIFNLPEARFGVLASLILIRMGFQRELAVCLLHLMDRSLRSTRAQIPSEPDGGAGVVGHIDGSRAEKYRLYDVVKTAFAYRSGNPPMLMFPFHPKC